MFERCAQMSTTQQGRFVYESAACILFGQTWRRQLIPHRMSPHRPDARAEHKLSTVIACKGITVHVPANQSPRNPAGQRWVSRGPPGEVRDGWEGITS